MYLSIYLSDPHGRDDGTHYDVGDGYECTLSPPSHPLVARVWVGRRRSHHSGPWQRPPARPMDFETYIDIDALEPEVGRRPQTPRLRLLRAMVAARAIGRMRCLSVSRFRRPTTHSCDTALTDAARGRPSPAGAQSSAEAGLTRRTLPQVSHRPDPLPPLHL
jgi:hypothetical protein